MSELVEKVQDAILEAYDFDGIATEKMSRAAIAAVAEWLDDALKDDDGRIYVPQFLRAAAEGK